MTSSTINQKKESNSMRATEQTLIAKIATLPPTRLAEVEDFVDFLRAREDDKQLTQQAMQASSPAFARVWDNEADAAYDRL